MKRWIVRSLAALAGVAAVGFLLGWIVMRASLPVLDGEERVDGLAGIATIERDAAGIPTISAATRADLAFATGFVHGQDRFFQMDLIRRRSAGELAALVGPAAVDADRRVRFHRFRRRAAAVVAGLAAEDAALLDSYAAGVNAGLASLGARPFEYFLLNADPRPWVAEDSLLVVYTMFLQLNDSRAVRDIRRGRVRRVVPADVYAWLYPEGTGWDAPLMGMPRSPVPAPAPGAWSIRDRTASSPPAADESGRPDPVGSNNWAVGGALTADGRAIVANDMHLGLSVPNIYYRARLVVDGTDEVPRDVTGVTLPGAPFVVAGSNTHVAWGYTNSYGDWADAVILRPGAEPGTYRSPRGDLPFAEYPERIGVRGGEPVEVTVRETIWGPVDTTADYPEGELAVCWIAHDPDAVNLRIIDLETAGTVSEALDIANTIGMPPQNFVAGDAQGNIGWTIAGRIPLRSGDFDPRIPADWSTSGGWLGWLDAARYPRIVNPENHRIWTANARVADGEALRIIGDGGYDLGARARQIRDSLNAADRFSPGDMLRIQYDDRAVFLSRWQQLLLDELDDDTIAAEPKLGTYRDLVAGWIPRAAPESAGYRLVRAFRLEVQARVFHGLTEPVRAAYGGNVALRISNQFEGPLWGLVTDRPAHLLPGPYASWHELLVDAVRENIRRFEARYSGPLSDRTWGERNTASIRHPLSGAVPWLSKLLDMPREPLSGDVNMPKVQGPAFGASERFAVAPGDEAHGIMHMPTGQSGHPLSPYYRDGHDDWVRGRPSPFLPGAAQHRLTLRPAG